MDYVWYGVWTVECTELRTLSNAEHFFFAFKYI